MSDLFKDVDKVLKERGEDYGDAEVSFKIVASLWSRILGIDLCSADVVMCMAALKFCREQVNPKYDNIIDMIGYLKLYSSMVQYQPEATPPPAGKQV